MSEEETTINTTQTSSATERATKFIGDIIFNNGDKDIRASELATVDEVNEVLKEYGTKQYLNDNFPPYTYLNNNVVKKTELTDYVKTESLTETLKDYATFSYINNNAVNKSELTDYAKTSDLSGYVESKSIVDVPTFSVKIPIISVSEYNSYTLDINYNNPPKIIYIDAPPERKETYTLESNNTYNVTYKSNDYDTTAHKLYISRSSAYIQEGFYGDATDPQYNIDTSYDIYDISNENDDVPKEIPTVEYVKQLVSESTPTIPTVDKLSDVEAMNDMTGYEANDEHLMSSAAIKYLIDSHAGGSSSTVDLSGYRKLDDMIVGKRLPIGSISSAKNSVLYDFENIPTAAVQYSDEIFQQGVRFVGRFICVADNTITFPLDVTYKEGVTTKYMANLLNITLEPNGNAEHPWKHIVWDKNSGGIWATGNQNPYNPLYSVELECATVGESDEIAMKSYVDNLHATPSSTTITHYCPIEEPLNTINDFIIGSPVYLTGNVYKFDKQTKSFIRSTIEDTTDCICSVKTNGKWSEYVGICVKIDEENRCVTFATHGDYLVKVTDTSCYSIGDEVFIDEGELKVLSGQTSITSKIKRTTVGIVTSKINDTMLSVFKS